MRRRSVATVLLIACLVSGCDASEETRASTGPAPVADQECGVCGMMVRAQSAPRAQVVHRDGARSFVCGMADLLVYLSAPSSHGRADRVFVEVLSGDEDLERSWQGVHPWVAAEDAVYVVGVDRPRIMGPAVLAYADRTTAERVAGAHAGARVMDWSALGSWWKAKAAGDE